MELIRFIIIGLATGGIYAIVVEGMILVFRASGILNFAQGALVMFGAYTYYEFTLHGRMNTFVALLLTMLFTGVAGALVHLLVLRPMRNSSATARVVATLGVMIVLQSAAALRYGANPLAAPSFLPSRTVEVVDGLRVGIDRLLIVAVTFVLTGVLWWSYKRTSFGRVTSAIAESPRTASSLGHSPDVVATLNWFIAGALAGLASVFVVPITFLAPSPLVLLVLPAIAAGLLGGFNSFWLAFAAAMGLGVGESLLQRYASDPGWATSLPFLVVIAVLVIRGQALPIRSAIQERLPGVGTGRVRPIPSALLFLGLSYLLLFRMSIEWQTAFTVTIALAIICLSVVTVTGYAGQISLAQYVLAGLGALIAANLVNKWNFSFVAALLVATVAVVLIGGVVAIPSLRTRGISLAVATLGLASVGHSLVLSNPTFAGFPLGIRVTPPSILGWDIDPFRHAGRYAFVTLCALALLCLATARIRRGPLGRRFVAVRSNERAAASLGVNVYAAKVAAFMIGAAVAAVGGVFLAFLQPTVLAEQFDALSSINVLAVTVVGGVGSIGGAILGATMISGGVFSQLLRGYHDLSPWLPLIGGVSLLLVLQTNPDGMFETNRRILLAIAGKFRRRDRVVEREEPTGGPVLSDDLSERERIRVRPRRLTVDGMRVRFGSTMAVNDVSLEVAPGQIHGLIGPNGAGKTTFIDAVTGFLPSSQGSVRLDGEEVHEWSVRRRSAAGLGRSFQSLELFDDLTVAENLLIASENPSWSRMLVSILVPRPAKLSSAALAAVACFDLESCLGEKVRDLPYGRRRLVAIARAVAAAPSILLLDEPAAGLGDAEARELGLLIKLLARDWGFGFLLVEHNVDMVLGISDSVTVLDSGSVLVSGPPDEIRSNPLVLDAYLGSRHAQTAAAS